MNTYTEEMRITDQCDDIQIKIEVLESIQRTHNTFIFWERIEELYDQLYNLKRKLYD